MNGSGPDCGRLREGAAELALGILPARERAAAVAHLDRCPDCRAHVARLTAVGDGLLGLLPGTEPPAGFESRVLRTVAPPPETAGAAAPLADPVRAGPPRTGVVPPGSGPASPVRGRRRARLRRVRLALAGAGAAVALGFGGWAVGGVVAGAPSGVVAPDARVLEAELVAGGSPVGRIYAHPAEGGGEGWVSMAVDLGDRAAAGDGPVRCLLVRTDGSVVALGSFALHGGEGYWGAPAPVGPEAPAGARLVAPDGTVLATARFTAS
ncbi:hypothetical protein ACF09L_17545 [Streptomyces sp. NPDC014779]|uniref:hypothetical protein n=1 Tax=Streptomyces sp. NPDC014779 TaxID=3364911 RepID=UPI0036FFF94F